MPPRLKPISLYPLSFEEALAALVRTPPPPKIVKAVKAKRRASKGPGKAKKS